MTRYLVYSLVPLAVLFGITLTMTVCSSLIALALNDPSILRSLITRLTQVSLLLSIFPAMAYFKFSKEDLGFTSRSAFFKQLPQGFALGLLTLMPVFILLYLLGVHAIDQSQEWTFGFLAKKTLMALLLASLIGIVEESVFRGLLLTGLQKKLPTVAAIVICSVYFGALHFLDSRTEIPVQDFNFFSGFVLLGQAYANVLDPVHFWAFVSLFVVGCFLAVLRTEIKESLGLCIGCHAGWVWMIKMNASLFDVDAKSEYLFLVNNYNFVVGPLVTVWLSAAIGGYFLYKKVRA